MTAVSPPSLTDAPTSPDRSDRTTFTARSIALDNWTKNYHIPELRTALANAYANALDVYASAAAAQSDRTLAAAAAAAVAAQSPTVNAAAAAASAAAAAVSAAIAQAVSPDTPVRLNTRRITADLTIGSAYNAASVGPIFIADGITVTVQDNATWSIN